MKDPNYHSNLHQNSISPARSGTLLIMRHHHHNPLLFTRFSSPLAENNRYHFVLWHDTAGNGLWNPQHPGIKCYTATVWILTRLSMNSSSTGTSSLSSFRQEIWRFIASLTCSIVSSTVSPCEKHPGSAGTSAQKPPSSALWIKNRVFPGIFPYNHCANSSSVKPAILIAALRSPILTVPETGMVSLPT